MLFFALRLRRVPPPLPRGSPWDTLHKRIISSRGEIKNTVIGITINVVGNGKIVSSAFGIKPLKPRGEREISPSRF